MTTAHPFTWSDRFLLGHHSIDATHVEFVECVEALLNADGAAIPGALDAFIRHAEAHFQQENDWLGAPDFPGGGECHIEEHEKVLNAAYDVRALVADVADSLLVTEVFTPAGHWSSYPSHRHDEDDGDIMVRVPFFPFYLRHHPVEFFWKISEKSVKKADCQAAEQTERNSIEGARNGDRLGDNLPKQCNAELHDL